MQHGLGAPLVRGAGHLAAEDVVLQERHRAGVLHGAGVELRNEQLVVLAERIGHTEIGVVEVEALLGLGEQPLGVHELRQRGTAEDAQRDVPVLVGVGIPPHGVRPGDQRHQVGAHLRGGGEGVYGQIAVAVDGGGGAVGDHLPVRGRGHHHVEGGLEVRLVETGEHPLGVGGLELRVQIHLAVHRVDEAVQALAGVGVAALGIHDDDVVVREADQRDAGGLVVAGDVDRVAVEHRAVHHVCGQVQMGVRARQRGETHRRHRSEGFVAGQVKVDPVVLDGDEGCAFGGLVAGQVRKHGLQPILG